MLMIRARFVALAVASTLLFSLAAGAPAESLESALELSASPGSIALLIPYGKDPRVHKRWSDGLMSPDPEVRAITARVVGLTRATFLADRLSSALREETDMFAAREQIRALATLKGQSAEDVIFAATERLGGEMWSVAAETVLLSEGVPGLQRNLARFSQILDNAEMEWAFGLAMDIKNESLDDLAAEVLALKDPAAWHAFLSMLAEKRARVEGRVLLDALSSPSLAVSGETAWHLIEVFGGTMPLVTHVWSEALGAGEAGAGPGGDGIDYQFGRELLARALGKEPVTNYPWVTSLQSETSSHIDFKQMDALAAPYLTKEEINAVKKRFERLFEYKTFSTKQSLPVGRKVEERIVRTVSDFPKGFVQDLLRVTGCKAGSRNNVIQADLIYDALGRPRKVTLVKEPERKRCKGFATIMFSTSLSPPGHIPDPEKPERLLLFLESDPLEKLEEARFNQWPRNLVERTDVKPPRRSVFVKPEYPEGNRQERIEGLVVLSLVVNPEGHVKNVSLTKVSHDAFLLSAIRAVLGWEYEPATSAGKPVAVNLIVIVEYNIRR